jgi:hypothetical protein
MEDAEQLMRDVVFDEWRKSDCESYADTLKLMSLIDVFLPYLPLGRQHMPDLVKLALKQRQANYRHNSIHLQWEPGVVQLVANKVSANARQCAAYRCARNDVEVAWLALPVDATSPALDCREI